MARQGALLWAIRHRDSAHTSFLFGTMHTRDLQSRKLALQVVPYLQHTDLFMAELAMDHGMRAGILPGFRAPAGKTLSECLSPSRYQKYRRILLKAYGIDIVDHDALIPFAVISMLTDRIVFPVYAHSPDQYLWDQAKALGLACDGIETPEEQLAVLESYPIEDQLRDFVRIARDVTGFRQKVLRMVRCYGEGRLHQLTILARKGLGNFRYTLVDRRNIIMAERIASRVRDQNAMFAIGAGHLGGKGGVISRLKRMGYSLVPVPRGQ